MRQIALRNMFMASKGCPLLHTNRDEIIMFRHPLSLRFWSRCGTLESVPPRVYELWITLEYVHFEDYFCIYQA